MKFFTQIIAAAFVGAACFGANAQTEAENNTMYLIKGDRVVSKYNVDDVDYVSFKLPDGVIDDPIWIKVEDAGKNTISYTINTENENTAYAHGIVSHSQINYLALDYVGEEFDNLDEETKVSLFKTYLPYCAYLGVGTDTYTQKDWTTDVYEKKVIVKPGSKYYVCAWEVDPTSQEPLEAFAYTETKTLDPGVSPATLNVSFKRQNSDGLAFDIQGSDDLNYVVTVYGMKDVMESFIEVYGFDFLLDVYGGQWTLGELQGSSDLNPDIEAATWPAYEPGEYVIYVRGYDANGDIVDAKCYATAEMPESTGPKINIFTKSKGNGKVSVTFEMTPSNVTEAYVRLLPENDLDDLLNDGWKYDEIASSSQSTDITSVINTTGEYTYTKENLEEGWYSLLIYGKDENGGRTTLRLSFYPDNDSEWAVYEPQHIAPRKSAKAMLQSISRKPVIDRVK